VNKRGLRELWRDRCGATAIVFAVMASGMLGVVGLGIDVGGAMVAKQAFKSSLQAAALAGAQNLAQSGATSTTVSTAVTNWLKTNGVSNMTLGTATASLSCVTATSNLPTCSSSSPNVVTVTQTGTFTTHFLKAFGVTRFTMTASARAAKAGGAGTPLNIMFVLDSTQSMNTADTGCTVPGVKSPTQYQCAQYSIQSVLKVLQPTMANVGLMIFPGTATKYTPGKPCPTQPSSVPYLSSTIYYQIGSFTSAFNNGAGTLTDTSAIVESVGDVGTSLAACISAKGGEGTYIAEVITKAQAAFPTTAGYKNVIILLSDGNASASQAQLNNQSSKVSKQCGQYVTAAQTATTAGTTVYAVAYGAPTSGCSSGDTYNPCTAMQAAATDTSKFFSTNNTCPATISSNTVANLPTIFTQIAVNLTKPRLL
jgi:Flp pilus assembly protein TadG